jgi:hypothetical protein
MKDINDIIPFLHTLNRATFFTCDFDFYEKSLCHKSYCIVFLKLGRHIVAKYVRLFLSHSEFKTKAKRMGRVARVSQTGIHCWQLNVDIEQFFEW